MRQKESNRKRAILREKCRERLSEHIRNNLGISVPPSDVRLITTPQDPYKWAFVPEKSHLFQKQLSKHCIRAYKEIDEGIDEEVFKAIPTDASNRQPRASATITKAMPEKTSNLEVETRPAASFTAKIDVLTSHNLRLTTELEQCRSAASGADTLNRELAASLEAAQLGANTMQLENERMKEACRRNSLAANFFRAKAVQSDAAIKEIFSFFEAAKAKIPVVCPDP